MPSTRWRFWGPVLLYMAAIFFVSSLSNPPLPQNVSDKSAHWLAYLGLGVVIVRALARGLPARVTMRIALVAVVLAALYGASDEFHQRFVPGRSSDVHDLYADVAGAAMGVIACWAWGIISLRPDV